MSPGASGEICDSGGRLGTSSSTGLRVEKLGVKSVFSGSFSYSQNLMVCGALFSVIVKSLAVRPSMGLPSLSRTETISTTKFKFVENFAIPSGPVVAGGAGTCWAVAAIKQDRIVEA